MAVDLKYLRSSEGSDPATLECMQEVLALLGVQNAGCHVLGGCIEHGEHRCGFPLDLDPECVSLKSLVEVLGSADGGLGRLSWWCEPAAKLAVVILEGVEHVLRGTPCFEDLKEVLLAGVSEVAV